MNRVERAAQHLTLAPLECHQPVLPVAASFLTTFVGIGPCQVFGSHPRQRPGSR